MHELVNQANSEVVIERNPNVMKTTNWFLGLGPEDGNDGGQIVAVGTAEQMAKVRESWIGRELGAVLEKGGDRNPPLTKAKRAATRAGVKRMALLNGEG